MTLDENIRKELEAAREEEEFYAKIEKFGAETEANLWIVRKLVGAPSLGILDYTIEEVEEMVRNGYTADMIRKALLSRRPQDMSSVEEIKKEMYKIEKALLSRPSIWEIRDMSGVKLRHATPDDYREWLAGRLKTKGIKGLTDYYDYPIPVDVWYVAKEDFELRPLYGANAIHIIVPEHVRFLGGGLGHCNLYFMKDFKNVGGWVPVYGNIRFSTESEEGKKLNEMLEKFKIEKMRERYAFMRKAHLLRRK